MELIRVKDNHLKSRVVYKYGCVCPNCDSAFIFAANEAKRPKMLDDTEKNCYINCPHCKYIVTLDACKKLKDELEITAFKLLHSED